MNKTIKNSFLKVCIASRGAELISVKTPDEGEWLWQANPDIWERQAPALFPWCGRIKNRTFTCNGKTYAAGIHGFISDRKHKCAAETDSSAEFVYVSTNEDLNFFPYPFIFKQRFNLDGAALRHEIEIKNSGQKTMPFGLGYHPGFLCPFSPKKSAADYSLVFDSKQSPDSLLFTKDDLSTGKKIKFMEQNDRIPLFDDMFKNGSLCLTNIDSKAVSLKERDSFRSIELRIEGIPYLLLWSRAGLKLQFICIEPWYTLPDFADAPPKWENKKNLLRLEAGKTFTSSLTMTFHTK